MMRLVVVLAMVGSAFAGPPSVAPSLRACWKQAPACRREYDDTYGTWEITYGGSNGGHKNYSQHTFVGTEKYKYYKGDGASECAASAETHILSERFSYSTSTDGALVRHTLETLTQMLVGAQAQADVDTLNNASSPNHCICNGTWALGVERTLTATSCNFTTCPRYYNPDHSNFAPKVYGVRVEQVTLNPNGKAAGAVEGCTLRRTDPYVAEEEVGWAAGASAEKARAALTAVPANFAPTPFTRCDGNTCGTVASASWAQPTVMVLIVAIPILMCAVTYWGYKYKVNRLEEGVTAELSEIHDDGSGGQEEAAISVSNQATVM